MAAGGSWSNNTYTSAKAGNWTVTASFGSVNDTATLTVNPASLDHLTISPISTTIIAGTSQTYQVDSYDIYDNLIASNVAAALKVNGVSITGNTVLETIAGAYTIDASYNGKTITATLIVNPAAKSTFAVSTISSTTAGAALTVIVVAEDAYGNIITGCSETVHLTSTDPLAVLGTDFQLTYGVGVFSVTFKTAGTQTVTVTSIVSSTTGTSNTIMVNHGPASILTVLPKNPVAITAGSSQVFTAIANDAYGNSWNVTDQVSWDIAVAASGSWSGSTYNSVKAGSWIVTASFGSATGLVSLTVAPAGLDHLTISPTNASIIAGETQPYSVNSYDMYANLIASDVDASLKVNGSTVLGVNVSKTVVGSYAVEASYNGKNRCRHFDGFFCCPFNIVVFCSLLHNCGNSFHS